MFAKGHLHISNFILKLYVLHVFAGVTSTNKQTKNRIVRYQWDWLWVEDLD
jgi:hypothetical protein